jgi:hypothetical protein
MYSSRINELFNFLRYVKFDLLRFLDDLEKLNLYLDLTQVKEEK